MTSMRAWASSGSLAVRNAESMSGNANAVPGPERFTNRTQQIVMSAFSAMIIVIGLGGLASGATLSGLVWVGLGVLLFVNAVTSSYVQVDRSAVVVRSVLWLRRYPLLDVRSAEVATGAVGLVGYPRAILVLNLVDGRRIDVTTLNESRSVTGSGRSTVARAVDCINARIG
jgi:hypothetical protein